MVWVPRTSTIMSSGTLRPELAAQVVGAQAVEPPAGERGNERRGRCGDNSREWSRRAGGGRFRRAGVAVAGSQVSPPATHATPFPLRITRMPLGRRPSGFVQARVEGVTLPEDEHGANAESEKMLEVDFVGGKPVVAGDQFGRGKKRSGPFADGRVVPRDRGRTRGAVTPVRSPEP
jgi:hypothetical protein